MLETANPWTICIWHFLSDVPDYWHVQPCFILHVLLESLLKFKSSLSLIWFTTKYAHILKAWVWKDMSPIQHIVVLFILQCIIILQCIYYARFSYNFIIVTCVCMFDPDHVTYHVGHVTNETCGVKAIQILQYLPQERFEKQPKLRRKH